jgi:hypothetical protein
MRFDVVDEESEMGEAAGTARIDFVDEVESRTWSG